jgi:hypothetical protein
VADAVEVILEDVKAGKSVKTHLARKRMLALFQESCCKQFLDQITEADWQPFIRFLRKHYGWKDLRRFLGLLKHSSACFALMKTSEPPLRIGGW